MWDFEATYFLWFYLTQETHMKPTCVLLLHKYILYTCKINNFFSMSYVYPIFPYSVLFTHTNLYV